MTVDGWILADEAAQLAHDMIAALRPMRARRPEARFAMLSTALSRSDPFWTAWSDGDPTWIRLLATADTALFSPEFLERERRALGEHAFLREYYGIPMGSGASLFTWDLFDRAMRTQGPKIQPGAAFEPTPIDRGTPVPNPFLGVQPMRRAA
jgi:hypothetical protein